MRAGMELGMDLDRIVPRDRRAPLLFDALPSLARSVPWRPLAHTPTALERIPSLEGWLGRDDLWMKRDDLASPLYGGNKVRRYEFVLAEAEQRGAKRIVTAGGIASTQVLATALFGRALGFEVRAVLFDQPITRFAKSQLLSFADAGAELVWGGSYLGTAIHTIHAMARDRRDGNYLILPGAASPLANLGYLDAMLELAQQVELGQMPRPDAIVLPTGSSGTLAALALGAAHLGWDTVILGVRITVRIATNALTIGSIVRATDRFLEARDPKRWKRQRGRVRWELDHRAIGGGYGVPTPESVDALERVRALTGAEGEVTYSAKALAALRRIAIEPRWAGKTILLWNTLSTARPALSPAARDRVPASMRRLLELPEVA